MLRVRDCAENALSHNALFYLKSSVMFGMPPLSIEAERKRCPAAMCTVPFEREKAVGGYVNPGGAVVAGIRTGRLKVAMGMRAASVRPKRRKEAGETACPDCASFAFSFGLKTSVRARRYTEAH